MYKRQVAIRADPTGTASELTLPSDLADDDVVFLSELASNLNMQLATNVYDPVEDKTATVLSLSPEALAAVRDGEAQDMEFRAESESAVNRVLQSYLDASVGIAAEEEVDDKAAEAAAAAAREAEINEKWTESKRRYFKDKLELPYTPEVARQISFNYVEGLQWVLHYYYSGIASWGWYYHYHYAPPVSDPVSYTHLTLPTKRIV